MKRGDLQVFANGVVYTMDPGAPVADWVLVEGGRIRSVGRGEPPVAGAADRIDLHGCTVIPAFTDAHVHLTWIATSFMGPDLAATTSTDEVLAVVSAWKEAGRGAAGDWIVADGFDESTWADRRLPTRRALDAVEARRPVLVRRVCGHVGVVNSRALEHLPPGAHTDRDSGRIAETDLWALNDRLRPAPEQLAAVLPRVFSTLHAHGIAAVHDVASTEMLRALQLVRGAGELPLRVSCSLPTDRLEHLRTAGVQCGFGDDRLRILGIKVFVDGSLGARTAFLREPYSDDPTTRGTALHSPAALTALVDGCEEAGLQLMIHAIGDAALERVLDCVRDRFAVRNPLRHRLEHIEVTPDDLVQRLAASGLLACVQPNFAGRWSHRGGMNEQRLGPRLAHCNAYRTLDTAGVRLAFGSDCMPLGALGGVQAAVQHPDFGQRLAALRTFELYTAAAAHLVHAEDVCGRIRPGLSADFAVLSKGATAAAGLASARVEATYIAGTAVYLGPHWPGRPG